MINTPINLNFAEILFSFEEDLWETSLIDDLEAMETKGNISILKNTDPYFNFETDLIVKIRDAPAEVSRLQFLTDGTVKREFDRKGFRNNVDNYIPGENAFLMSYTGDKQLNKE